MINEYIQQHKPKHKSFQYSTDNSPPLWKLTTTSLLSYLYLLAILRKIYPLIYASLVEEPAWGALSKSVLYMQVNYINWHTIILTPVDFYRELNCLKYDFSLQN